MKFAYGDVPPCPVIPHTALLWHPPCKYCTADSDIMLVVADLGKCPIPYALIILDTLEIAEDLDPHIYDWVEYGLLVMYSKYMGLRN
jgi:hypothetical protein